MGGGYARRASRSAWNAIWKAFVTRRTKRFSRGWDARRIRGKEDRGPGVRWKRRPGSAACGKSQKETSGFAGAVDFFAAAGGDGVFPVGIRGFAVGIVIAEGAGEFFHLVLGFLPGDAVALLDDAHELIALAADHVEVIFGELAPLFLHFAGDLFPFPFDLIPVH